MNRQTEKKRDRVEFSYDKANVVLTGMLATCTRCGKVKPASMFGFRRMKPGDCIIRNQPQCSECRSGKTPDELTYAQLMAVLKEFGFEHKFNEGTHLVFVHTSPEFTIRLFFFRSTDIVPNKLLTQLKRELDARNILPKKEWNKRFPR